VGNRDEAGFEEMFDKLMNVDVEAQAIAERIAKIGSGEYVAEEANAAPEINDDKKSFRFMQVLARL